MKREVYREVLGLLSELPFGACPNVGLLRSRYPGIAVETFISIYSQEIQYKVIKSNHIHKSRVEEYLARYMAGEDLLLLSAAINFPCCLLLRRMLESLLRVHKQSISDVLRNPSLLPTLLDVDDSCNPAQQRNPGASPGPSSQATSGEGGAPVKPAVSAHFLARLQLDVARSSLADCSYSPYADIAKQATGVEFELLLAEKLKAAGLDYFWTEDDLRNQGYYKTPDVRLQVPIAVRDKRAHPHGDGWRIVTWIDSKATFGDDRTHTKQYEEQYSTYVNRYGPGLIIYWFDFIEDLDTDAGEKGAKHPEVEHVGMRVAEVHSFFCQHSSTYKETSNYLSGRFGPNSDFDPLWFGKGILKHASRNLSTLSASSTELGCAIFEVWRDILTGK